MITKQAYKILSVSGVGCLVEAAGIEPASESTTPKHLHAYSAYLISNAGLPADGPADIPSLNLSPDLRESPGGSLLYDAVL